ncbi:MAG: lysophospholipid acyltransferase family protein [Rhodocyclales bacterium]|nr:lysophospholipid acyltransferase family protein [Rhodocyclales bacterium]
MVDTLSRLLARLPLPLLYRLGGWAGWLAWCCSPAWRARLNAHLELALGADAPAARRAAIAEVGRQALELPFVWLRPQDEVLTHVVKVEGRELIEAALADGASVLVITPHLGCFELIAHYAATLAPVTILFRPPRKAALAPLMEAGRARGNVRVAPASVGGVRRLLKALRGREIVAMAPDQVPQAGDGMWMPFFGRPAWTMTLPARLSEVDGVRVIMGRVERLPRGAGYTLHFSAPREAVTGSLAQRCGVINREIERQILACPTQYLWAYNRYKRPAGVAPPEASQC